MGNKELLLLNTQDSLDRDIDPWKARIPESTESGEVVKDPASKEVSAEQVLQLAWKILESGDFSRDQRRTFSTEISSLQEGIDQHKTTEK